MLWFVAACRPGLEGSEIQLSGIAFGFGSRGAPVVGAQVSIDEMPEIQTETDANGHWNLDVPAGSNATPVFDAEG